MQLGRVAYLPAGNSLHLSNLVASNCPVISTVWKEQEAGFPQTECHETFPKKGEYGAFLTPLCSDVRTSITHQAGGASRHQGLLSRSFTPRTLRHVWFIYLYISEGMLGK